MTLTTPNLRAPHAFTSRAGGVSTGPFAGLNLDDRQDDPQAVAENRRRLSEALGFHPDQVSRLEQVHGTRVVPAQPGDVPDTYADSARLARAINWRPATPIAEGVRRFADWFREWHAREP